MQDRTSTELELWGGRRARMTTELMEFGASTCYRLTQYGLRANPAPDFSDLSQDMSVTLLFSSSGYGPHLIAQYDDVAQVAIANDVQNGHRPKTAT